jgi:capsular exopolysaccharide synthesis family protein
MGKVYNMLSELLVTLVNPNSQASEEYRRLRTNIEFANVDKKLKVVNITSVLANEGKTAIASNLAIMFANKVNKVLLIDTDLRNPTIHRNLAIKHGKGLTDLLLDYSNNKANFDQIDMSSYVNSFKHENLINTLDVITAGRKVDNPAEIIGSQTFKNMISKLAEMYDMVILDSAPCGFIVDGIITSSVADGTILVSEYGRNKFEATKEAVNSLKQAGATVIGGLISKAPVNNDYFGRYFNSSYYYNQTQGGEERE